jgi:hypothetical protein
MAQRESDRAALHEKACLDFITSARPGPARPGPGTTIAGWKSRDAPGHTAWERHASAVSGCAASPLPPASTPPAAAAAVAEAPAGFPGFEPGFEPSRRSACESHPNQCPNPCDSHTVIAFQQPIRLT